MLTLACGRSGEFFGFATGPPGSRKKSPWFHPGIQTHGMQFTHLKISQIAELLPANQDTFTYTALS
jgi:hypothetical protein